MNGPHQELTLAQPAAGRVRTLPDSEEQKSPQMFAMLRPEFCSLQATERSTGHNEPVRCPANKGDFRRAIVPDSWSARSPTLRPSRAVSCKSRRYSDEDV